MLTFEISGRPTLILEHLVLDFNGTLAVDGILIDGVKDKLAALSEHLSLHVITADTFGTVERTLAETDCTIRILDQGNQDGQKQDFVQSLNAAHTAAIGNGLNDRLMLESAALGICVLQAEGCAAATLTSADIVTQSILDACDLLLLPQRLNATLRR